MQSLLSFVVEILAFFYELTGNLGWGIILFTIVLRLVLAPITIPSLKTAQRMKELQPEIKKLKEKFAKDAQKLTAAQIELFKKHNINPLAGCIPQLIQLGLLLLLYHALLAFLQLEEVHGVALNTGFFWLELDNPDTTLVLPILAAVTQFLLTIMIMPTAAPDEVKPVKNKKKKKAVEPEKKEDFSEIAMQVQKQMMYILPVMTGVIAATFPSGLALYWVVTTVFGIIQQGYISGWNSIPEFFTTQKQKISQLLQYK
jgi:YidC/Oxa1 family membrane protein insertase